MDPHFPGMVDPARLTRFKKTIGSFRDSEQAAVKPALAGGLLLPPMPGIPGAASARGVPVPEWRSPERHPVILLPGNLGTPVRLFPPFLLSGRFVFLFPPFPLGAHRDAAPRQ